MKVNDLSKELNITNKVLIEYLQTKNSEIKSHMNKITEEEEAYARKHFEKAEEPKKEVKAEPKEAVKEPAKEEPKKKKISMVINRQYSSNGNGNGNGNNTRPSNNQRRNDNQYSQNQGRNEQRVRIRPLDIKNGERPSDRVRPDENNDFLERTGAPKKREEQTARNAAPQENTNRNEANRNGRNEGGRQNGNRFDSNRQQGNRNDGNRQGRGDGFKPFNRDGAKNDGNKPFNREGGKNFGDRSFNKDGARNDGNRPFNRDSGKNFGDRNFNKDHFDKDKNEGARPQGQRNGQGNFGGRKDRDRNSYDAPAEQISGGKDQRSRDWSDKKKNENNHDKTEKMENTKALEKSVKAKNQKKEEQKDEIRTLTLPDSITIKDLADLMKVQATVIVKKLFLKGQMVTINEELDFDAAEEIALEFNCICEHEEKVDVIAELLKEEEEDESTLVARPPVVCVMGHVDHGKTSLLDYIRSSKVTEKEAGGITQHIGAYTVDVNGQKVTFLDTPGHEAFTAMRMRGAKSTDIAILVVAADDGVMPQTVEAINHAKAAGIDIVVAVNKIDKPSANIERVKQELVEYELIAEDWGGTTIFCPVSAHTGEGIDNLLDMLLLTAEMRELKANPDRKARGLVIEGYLDKGRGPVATMLVQKGTLNVGDFIAVGSCHGKIRAMIDDKGRRIQSAGPSIPVEIQGLNDVPNAGDVFISPDTEKEARAFAETFIREGRVKLLEETKGKMSLEDLYSQIQAGELKELDIIVKADVQGSVEAVKNSLVKLSNDEVIVKVIHAGVGAINESDVVLASASNAIIIGFNVRPDNQAREVAERENVDLRLYKVIYQAIEDVEAAMKGLLDPKYEEKVLGHVEVRMTYKASGIGTIAGSFVMDGLVRKNASVRLMRGEEMLYDGPIASLKRFKDDAKEVKEGYECGIVLEKFNDIAEGDTMEVYAMVEIPR